MGALKKEYMRDYKAALQEDGYVRIKRPNVEKVEQVLPDNFNPKPCLITPKFTPHSFSKGVYMCIGREEGVLALNGTTSKHKNFIERALLPPPILFDCKDLRGVIVFEEVEDLYTEHEGVYSLTDIPKKLFEPGDVLVFQLAPEHRSPGHVSMPSRIGIGFFESITKEYISVSSTLDLTVGMGADIPLSKVTNVLVKRLFSKEQVLETW